MPKQQLALILASLALVLGGVAVVRTAETPEVAPPVDPRAQLSDAESQALTEAEIRTNELLAVDTLRSLEAAQRQMQSMGEIDTDGDGAGEYGYLAEMAGAVELRAASGSLARAMSPALLKPSLGAVDEHGTLEREGYYFAIYLPGPTVDDRTPGVAEAAGGGGRAGVAIDADNAEVLWCAYAWPVEPDTTGRRAFFINQEGDLLETPDGYGGTTNAPGFDAAYSDESPRDMAAPLSNWRGTANDGRAWTSIAR